MHSMMQKLAIAAIQKANEKTASLLKSKMFFDTKNLKNIDMSKIIEQAHGLARSMKVKGIDSGKGSLIKTVFPVTNMHGNFTRHMGRGEKSSLTAKELAAFTQNAKKSTRGTTPSIDALATVDPFHYYRSARKILGPNMPTLAHQYSAPLRTSPMVKAEVMGKNFTKDRANVGEVMQLPITSKLPESSLAEEATARLMAAREYGNMNPSLVESLNSFKKNNPGGAVWVPETIANSMPTAREGFSSAIKYPAKLQAGKMTPDMLNDYLKALKRGHGNPAETQSILANIPSRTQRIMSEHLDDSIMHQQAFNDAVRRMKAGGIQDAYYNPYMMSADRYVELKQENLGHMLAALRANGLITPTTSSAEIVDLLSRIAPLTT